MKTCTKCGQEKTLQEFYKDSCKVEGVRNDCKVCVLQKAKEYREKHPHKNLQYRNDNAKKISQYRKQRYAKQKLESNEYSKKYAKENPHKIAATAAKRRAAKKQRTPCWLTEDDHWVLEQAYELASLRTKVLGFAWHVDHIIPLQGKKVSGLHTPSNIQVIPAVLNLQKYNCYEVSQ